MIAVMVSKILDSPPIFPSISTILKNFISTKMNRGKRLIFLGSILFFDDESNNPRSSG